MVSPFSRLSTKIIIFIILCESCQSNNGIKTFICSVLSLDTRIVTWWGVPLYASEPSMAAAMSTSAPGVQSSSPGHYKQQRHAYLNCRDPPWNVLFPVTVHSAYMNQTLHSANLDSSCTISYSNWERLFARHTESIGHISYENIVSLILTFNILLFMVIFIVEFLYSVATFEQNFLSCLIAVLFSGNI